VAIQFSVELRTNQATVFETTIGTSPKFQLRTGAPPTNCAAADSGDLLLEIDLPSDWLNTATDGAASKNGTWQGAAVAAGVAAHFRIKDVDGNTHVQGTVTDTSGDGDMKVNNTNVAVSQTINVSSFIYTRGNA
jgi:hypothetical protein